MLPKPATEMSSGILRPWLKSVSRAANGHDIVNCLDGGGIGRLLNHLQAGSGAVLDRPPGLKYQPVVHFHTGFAQGPAIAFQALLSPRRGERARKERDARVPQLEQVLGDGVTRQKVFSLNADELAAEGSRMAEQDGGDAAGD